MNSDLTNKEKEIKEVVEGLSFDLNTDELWSHVESQLPPEETKRRPFLWWASGIAGVLFLAVFGYYFTQNTTDQNITHNTKIETSSEIKEPITIKNKNTQHSEIEITKINLADKVEKNKDLIGNQKTTIETKKNNPIVNSTDLWIADQNESSHIISNSSNIQIANIDINDIENQLDFENQKSEIRTSINENIAISTIARIEVALANPNIDLDINPKIIKPIKITRWKPYYGIYSGINMSNSSINSLSPEGLDKTQFEKESLLPGISTSLVYGFENNKGWDWNVGMNHSRLIGRYSNFDQTSSTTTQSGNTSYKIDSDGNVFGNQGEVNVTTVTQNDVVWHRQHDYINIQGTLGKTLIRFGSFSSSVFASAGYNIWSRHDGYYFEEGKDIITTFKSGEESPYEDQGVNLGGGLSLSYDLGNVSFGFSAGINQSIKNTTNSNNYYQLKNSQYGIQLGVVYRP